MAHLLNVETVTVSFAARALLDGRELHRDHRRRGACTLLGPEVQTPETVGLVVDAGLRLANHIVMQGVCLLHLSLLGRNITVLLV